MAQYRGIIIGSYRLTRLLGIGPVSKTHLAERQGLPGDQVVVKLFEALPPGSPEEQDQALEEVRLLTYLEHPALLPVLDDGLYEQVLYMVSPYATGGSLRQRLSRTPGELLALKEALSILRQVGEALAFAHRQQVVHANLKPENILFQEDGRALLGDFLLPVLAKSEQASRLHSTFAAFYMAPEQFHGVATPLSDQYALACLAYELLTGQPPFEAENLILLARLHATHRPVSPASLQPQRTQHVEQALLRALAKRPEKRYPDVQAFLADLLAPPPLHLPPTVEEETLPLPTPALPAFVPELRNEPVSQAAGLSAVPLWKETQALMSSQAGRPLLACTTPPVSPQRTWFAATLLSVTLLVILSGLLLFFDASTPLPGQVQVRALASVTAGLPAGSPTLVTAGVTASATLGSISLPASSAPVHHPSPVARSPSPTAQAPGVTPTPTPVPTLICSVLYQVGSQWQNGFVASITITNSGVTAIQSWTLTFSFGAGQKVSSGWNGHFTQSGSQVSVVNDAGDAVIAPGASATPGFRGSWKQHNPVPTSFVLNGVPCA
ncbi:MAG TPA: cellulose binding domain-containing protein [Ktedonobacteraceae bacterium]|jgi:serine/threonine protein kinase